MADTSYRLTRRTMPWRLSHRILGVNLIILLVLALALLFLDSFRNQLRDERQAQTRNLAELAATAVPKITPADVPMLLGDIGNATGARVRLYGRDGNLRHDSWRGTVPSYVLRDPSTQRWTKEAARAIDRAFNFIVGERSLQDFAEPPVDRLQAWPEARQALRLGGTAATVRNAPDLTPVLSAAARTTGGEVVLVTANDRNFTRIVRQERTKLAAGLLAAALFSLLLSLFLARTIARPLRRLALAAHRVRLGRSREVNVPRFNRRKDEIGLLARAVSDMSQALRHRMDNLDAFAADVTHELKNPLASLRSAVDGLDRIEDPKLRGQLLDVVRQDVHRLDRLIGDIGEAARTDAELARVAFEPVDLGDLVGQICSGWEDRRLTGNVRIAFARPRAASAIVMAEPGRLARAVDNLIDNAVSFSPPAGLVEVAVTAVADEVRIRIDDEGPGVPQSAREAIFNRFVSVRPDSDDFGRHSGLGLAIARAIVKGHDGEIDVADRDDAPSGARFTIRLSAASIGVVEPA
ncbi:two-component system sensor histidine kinase ChvG [Sphingomonas kaistensis]|uniref:histidine kinase n=1 Tax=Sphingomonas kaistensis TaxID=298708 RepID=A0A7X5Y6E2_9SPHN|nr:stimulus-sensing domain-containing protein [Sphingomonas kaistensis]NJC05914.1 two-component system sensor histidine kinase ChvG [Sphingomonas kaistensis]